jgi:hypothetical protein
VRLGYTSPDSVAVVGVHAVVIDREGRQVWGVNDPSGGSFDAAGDFDRLLGRVPEALTRSSIDLYGTSTFRRAQAASLLRELPTISERAEEGAEQRGLARLAVLAALCESDEGMSLRFVVD